MTLRLLVEYDGSAFAGWQVQAAGRTVQGEIERVLATALRQPVGIVGAGRTDAGVHARGQVAHAVVDDGVDVTRLLASLNGLLPPDVAVRAAEEAPDGFHARFDATARRYRYHVGTRPAAMERHTRVWLRRTPDWEAMNEAATRLVGRYDFSAFCRTRSETKNRTCAVTDARWLPDGRPDDWRFEIAADRFLHGMVRAIVGTLLDVGRGRRTAASVADVLASADRRAAGAAAPPHGLVLHAVSYPDRAFADLT